MNTRKLWMGAALLALTAACNRTDRQSSSVTGQDTASGQQAGNSVTLTGCLQPGEQGLGGSPPGTGARTSEGVDQFQLANARMTASSTDSSRSSSASTADASAPLYIVEGDTEELRRHVSHEVELMGRIEDTTDANSANPNARRFRAESIKDLSSTCSSSR